MNLCMGILTHIKCTYFYLRSTAVELWLYSLLQRVFLIVTLLSSNQPPEDAYEYNELSLIVFYMSILHSNQLGFGKAIFLHFIWKCVIAKIYLVLLSCYLALCVIQLPSAGFFLLSQHNYIPLIKQWCQQPVSGKKKKNTNQVRNHQRQRTKQAWPQHPSQARPLGKDSEGN